MASITLRHVSVAFPIYDSGSRSLKRKLFSANAGGLLRAESGSNKVSMVQALTDVSLDLRHGDRIGLLGHNGAGKTTLLRVLAGIYEPGGGTVDVQGHTAPLFDISLGMDPDASGYDNIELRGLFLGMSRRQIREKVEGIAEFTELGDFLDLPLRTYSDGMRMRLAFATSTAIDPDILLLDEGIGAGDPAFLEKARRRLRDFTSRAAIIVLASHNRALIKNMCDKAAVLEHGRLVLLGDTDEVLAAYAGAEATRGNQRRAAGQSVHAGD